MGRFSKFAGERSVVFLLQCRYHALTALVFAAVVIVWSLDGSSVIQSWRLRHELLVRNLESQPNTNLTEHQRETNFTGGMNAATIQTPALAEDTNFTSINATIQNKTPTLAEDTNFTNCSASSTIFSDGVLQETEGKTVRWVSTELEENLTQSFIARWEARGGEPCKDSRTAEIVIPGWDGNGIEFTAGESHEIGFHTVDVSMNPRCLGGDYFETDLSGEAWKCRPAVKDFGNGSYSILLQVHPDFVGNYTLTIILLFTRFQGLELSPAKLAVDKEVRRIGIKFGRGDVRLPSLQICQKSDFSRDLWLGRWTRLAKNDSCEISRFGRYHCLASDFPCHGPWCNGSLGSLESNGWVYSAHCSFRLYSSDSAWNCLKNQWILFWGDSNHGDTIRNLLNFVLGVPEIRELPRRFDMNFSNPKDASQSVRITNIFNGHWIERGNNLGLHSLRNEWFRNLSMKYFLEEETVPDTVILNSGLHDGFHWHTIRDFSAEAEFAASFWKEVMDSVKRRGLRAPQILYRTTVAGGGNARTKPINPYKMEAYNWVMLETFRKAGVISYVIDSFDMTFAWHYDNRCNDGGHYGRAPSKTVWRDGKIGHQYFVDLMLVHVLLNALCAR